MADNQDPFTPPDATVLRPRPGAGRRAEPAPRQAPPPDPMGGPAPFVRTSAAPGLNPLVQAASPLLLLAGQLRSTLSAPDVGGLRRHTLEEIRRFEERARASGVSNQIVVAARYVLCAGLDEAVLSTPWGGQSEWAQQTLLVTLHREAFGGAKFFEMLERLEQDPAQHLDLIELQYLSLAFGFAGKYQLEDRGHARLAEIQQEVYRQIRTQRGAPAAELAIRWRGLEDRRNPLIRYVPWWVVGAAAVALLAVTFVFYWTRLGSHAQPIDEALNNVGASVRRTVSPSPPTGGPTLRQLLKQYEDRGAISVQEDGRGQTTVTLNAVDLFPSGSARINPAFNDILSRIATAIDQVPGVVTVVGHTDSRPVRSLQIGNNAQLSRVRAESVAAILRSGLRTPARVDWTGKGDTSPIPGVPPSDERNRRVEIIHSGGF